jgi:hypothetical protein
MSAAKVYSGDTSVGGQLAERYRNDPAAALGDLETQAMASTVMGKPPGINLSSGSQFAPEGVAHPLQGLQRGVSALEPDLGQILRRPISSTVGKVPEAIKAAIGNKIQITPVDRPAPLWKTAETTPTMPGFNWQGSTPEEVQAQLQRMASRPRTSRPEGAPNVPTPEATPEVQNIPLPTMKPTAAATVDPYRTQLMPKMQPGTSTTIEAHGYNPNTQEAVVHFKNGGVYKYKGVPQEVYNQFQNSESQGSFHANNLKGRYVTEKIGQVKPNRFSPGGKQ